MLQIWSNQVYQTITCDNILNLLWFHKTLGVFWKLTCARHWLLEWWLKVLGIAVRRVDFQTFLWKNVGFCETGDCIPLNILSPKMSNRVESDCLSWFLPLACCTSRNISLNPFRVLLTSLKRCESLLALTFLLSSLWAFFFVPTPGNIFAFRSKVLPGIGGICWWWTGAFVWLWVSFLHTPPWSLTFVQWAGWVRYMY